MIATGRVLLFLALAVTAFTVSAELRIRLLHPGEPTTPVGQAAVQFAEQVGAQLEGAAQVDVVPGSDLRDQAGSLDALLSPRGGEGVIAVVPLGTLVARAPELRVFELPFLFDDMTAVHALADSDLGGKVLASLDDAGLKGLALWDEGMLVFTVSGIQPLRQAPADFAGKRLGFVGSEFQAEVIRSLGGTPEVVTREGVRAALAGGELDGLVGAWSDVDANGYHQVQDWVSVSNHAYAGYVVVTDAGFWNGLSDDLRERMGAILTDTTSKEREFAQRAELDRKQRVEEAGKAIVLGLTSEERDGWREAAGESLSAYEQQIGAGLVSEVREFLRR